MADTNESRTKPCSSCQSPLQVGARFCPDCGAAAVTIPADAPIDPVREVLRVALGRQYEIRRLLGRGGMGAVYLAAEAALEREVAIKVLPPDRSVTKDSRDRFRREARTAAKLSHPNIVPLHTFGDVDDTLYFVMGYVRGESLATRLKREGRIPVEEARRILIELCDALDYAHRLGIVHRDLKPDNVLIEEETGRAMLLDFGVAKAVGAGQTMTEVGSVLGTPQYMSPEQAQGKSDIDARSDLYSLGVMGYAMFAGRLPFEGATPGDVMAQHITKEAPALKTHAPDVPPEIASALTRCLEKDRDRRWPDAKSIKGAISLPSGEETPPALDGLGGFLLAPVFCALLLLYIGAWWLGGGDVAPPFPVVPLIAFSSALTPLLLLPWRWHHLRQLGFEPRRIVEAILSPLRYWPGWCPTRLRPRGDAWDRLPRELREFRSAIGLYFVTLVALFVPSIAFRWGLSSSILRTGHAPYELGPKTFDALIVVIGILPALAILAFGVRWELVRRRKGIDPYVSSRMINTPTSRQSFWAKPEVAAHLLPSNAVPARSTPSSARDLAAAISNAASSLTGAARTAAVRAKEAAAGVEAEITSIDAEIKSLAAGHDPTEAERLAARIEAMGPSQASEGEARRQMRELLDKQLALLRGVESRIETLKARRGRQLDLLRTLWQQTEVLVLSGGDDPRAKNAAASIEALCDEAGSEQTIAQTRDVDPALSDAPTIERR